MVALPAGEFLMGSPETEPGRFDEEGPQHRVRIRQAFALGETPVTVDAYSMFIAETGYDMGGSAWVWTGEKWETVKGKGWRDPGFAQHGQHPVTCVNWDDARAFIAWLNDRAGLKNRLDAYRLPSEAEWEYACRAGTTSAYNTGAKIESFQARFATREGTSPAGGYPATGYGLRDMHGNVWEWCEDVWHKSYDGAPNDGSAQLNGNSSLRVLRGGSWFNDPRNLRSARRGRAYPTVRNGNIGFRLARTLSTPAS